MVSVLLGDEKLGGVVLKSVTRASGEAYKHCKTIAASGAGVELLKKAGIIRASAEGTGKADPNSAQPGIVVAFEDDTRKIAPAFLKGIAQHRHWERELAI